MFVQHLRP